MTKYFEKGRDSKEKLIPYNVKENYIDNFDNEF